MSLNPSNRIAERDNPWPMNHKMKGKTFGKWFVLKKSPRSYRSQDIWECRCKGCGCLKDVFGNNLRRRLSKSCHECSNGCGAKEDLTGRVFGLWRVEYLIGRNRERRSSRIMWMCTCLGCGTQKELSTVHVKHSSKRCFRCGQKIRALHLSEAYQNESVALARKLGLPDQTPAKASIVWNALAAIGVPITHKDLAAFLGMPVDRIYCGARYLWRTGFAIRNKAPCYGRGGRVRGCVSKYHLSIRSLEILEARANDEKATNL